MKRYGLKTAQIIAGVAAVCALLSGPVALPMAASMCELQRPADLIETDSEGNAYYEDASGIRTGLIRAVPNFELGDVDGSGGSDALDAAAILTASAASGAGTSTAETALMAVNSGLANAEEAFVYADVNGDGELDALDASAILSHSAAEGSGSADPLGTVYYFADEDGILQTGWIRDGDVLRYAREDYTLCTGWAVIAGERCYFDASGAAQSGWVTIGNSTYLLDEGGAAAIGWTASDDGVRWFGEEGVMASGWTQIDGRTYYFGENGLMAAGWQELPTGRYYFGEDGVYADGWQDIDGERYHFSQESGMATGWYTENGKWYYFDENGAEQFGWLLLGSERFYLGEDGARLISWQVIDGNTYYFSGVYGHASSGWAKMNQGWFYFDENNIMRTGWLTVGDSTYYMGDDGIRRAGWQVIDGVTYYFGSNGALASGWVSIDGSKYYFTSEGTAVTGWQTIGGSRYYFYTDGTMATGFVDLGAGAPYYFDADGVFQYQASTSALSLATCNLLENASLSQKRTITVYNRQVSPVVVDFTITLKDSDIAILEQFAAEHFAPGMSNAEKLYITHQWIHYNVQYAYAGTLWNEIVNLSYADAIFNHQKGQCVQYNGAMAMMLAYMGYDVYMVRGWTRPGTQHFWTEVNIDGHTYMVECGNYGKNGDWQDFFGLIS